jgi:hypothetical protein
MNARDVRRGIRGRWFATIIAFLLVCSSVVILVPAGVAATAAPSGGGGPVVLDGMDPVCHASGGEPTDGYIAAVLSSLATGARRVNDGSIQVLGTGAGDWAGGLR